jgi:hypothetical protein
MASIGAGSENPCSKSKSNETSTTCVYTTYGVRNIRHLGNSFMNVNIWDIGVGGRGATISNIHQDARGTVIISGIMTSQNFSNEGQGTKIIDENNGLI